MDASRKGKTNKIPVRAIPAFSLNGQFSIQLTEGSTNFQQKGVLRNHWPYLKADKCVTSCGKYVIKFT